MDNLVLNLLVNRLKEKICGERIKEVSAARTGLLFQLESGPLFFSLLPELPLLSALAQGRVDSGKFAPLAGSLSLLIDGCVIVSITKEPLDRVIHIELKSDAGEGMNLHYEAIPRRVDLILTDAAGSIATRYRKLKVRVDEYSPPASPSGDIDVFNNDDQAIIELLEKTSGSDDPVASIVRRVKGIDSIFAREIFLRFGESEGKLKNFLRRVRSCDYSLAVFGEDDSDESLQLLPSIYRTAESARLKDFDDPLDAAEFFFRRRVRAHERAALRAEIMSALKARNKRIQKTGDTLQAELEKTKINAGMGNVGDLILSHMHLVKKGMQSIEVEDYFKGDGSRITIELDPALDPSANADRYYRLARKAKRGSEHVRERLLQLDSDKTEVEKFSEKLEVTEDVKQLRTLQKELVEKGWITQRQRKKLKVVIPPGRRFLSSEGVEIIIGRNDRDNEVVSFRVARENDFWMHAAGVSGSHVVVRNPQRKDEMHPDTLREAASLAAYYSRARNSSNVLVHWTKRRFIKKVKGGQPGKVLVSGYRSTTADPEIPETVKVIR